MIGALREWVVAITMTAFLLALAESLVSQQSMRRVLRLAGSVLLITVILAPLTGDIELPEEPDWEGMAELTEKLREEADEKLAAGIAEQLAAYISDKAESLGLSGQIRVTMKWQDGVPLPEKVKLAMPFDRELSTYIETELGLGTEDQQWQEA